MSTAQAQWAAQLRAVPGEFERALSKDDQAIRRRPAAGEWSAIEVLGHMIDKMQNWSHRVEVVLVEDRPALPGYDQDVYVRERDYQHAAPATLLAQLRQECEHFAAIVERVPDAALERVGVHEEVGPITLRQCIEAPVESASEHLEQLRVAQAGG